MLIPPAWINFLHVATQFFENLNCSGFRYCHFLINREITEVGAPGNPQAINTFVESCQIFWLETVPKAELPMAKVFY